MKNSKRAVGRRHDRLIAKYGITGSENLMHALHKVGDDFVKDDIIELLQEKLPKEQFDLVTRIFVSVVRYYDGAELD